MNERLTILSETVQQQGITNAELRVTVEFIQGQMTEMNENLRAIAQNVQSLTIAMSTSEAAQKIKRKLSGGGDTGMNRILLILVVTLCAALLVVLGVDIKDALKAVLVGG